MKNLFLFAIIVLFSGSLFAQQVNFCSSFFDESGNKIAADVIINIYNPQGYEIEAKSTRTGSACFSLSEKRIASGLLFDVLAKGYEPIEKMSKKVTPDAQIAFTLLPLKAADSKISANKAPANPSSYASTNESVALTKFRYTETDADKLSKLKTSKRESYIIDSLKAALRSEQEARKVAEARAEEATKLAQEWQARSNETQKLADEWKRKADQEKKYADEWRSRAEEARKLAEQWQQRAEEAIKIRDEWERWAIDLGGMQDELLASQKGNIPDRAPGVMYCNLIVKCYNADREITRRLWQWYTTQLTLNFQPIADFDRFKGRKVKIRIKDDFGRYVIINKSDKVYEREAKELTLTSPVEKIVLSMKDELLYWKDKPTDRPSKYTIEMIDEHGGTIQIVGDQFTLRHGLFY